ncbi:hypothetical protein [Peptostreptococcus faecalis]|uniref:hypothetical protein n=1 Tax=Peptostreptococcus faecalis TaxID=2045015 RepID=UPI000C7D09C5|nr:hypothetical protein [Peptostreptococcus faecalis]
MIYIYEACTGEIFTDSEELSWEELQCETCGDSGGCIGSIVDLNDIDGLVELYSNNAGYRHTIQILEEIGVNENIIPLVIRRAIKDSYGKFSRLKELINIMENELVTYKEKK